MEVQVAQEKSTRKEVFLLNHYNIQLTVVNKTSYKEQITPRRRLIKEETCKVFHNSFQLIELSYHLRPGQSNIKELEHLKEASQLNDIYKEDFMKEFRKYCYSPVEFFEEEPSDFVNIMDDPWCFDNEEFADCIQDFSNAYQKLNRVDVKMQELQLQIQYFEPFWKKTFHPNVTYKDLEISELISLPKIR